MSAWSDLCGDRDLMAIRTDVRHPFDADANGVALDFGGITVFVFEDPSDGYRSSAAEPMIAKTGMSEFGCNPEYIRAPVTIKPWTTDDEGCMAEGWEVVDRRNGQMILRVGTSSADDYYPSFVCDWRPQNLAENAAA